MPGPIQLRCPRAPSPDEVTAAGRVAAAACVAESRSCALRFQLPPRITLYEATADRISIITFAVWRYVSHIPIQVPFKDVFPPICLRPVPVPFGRSGPHRSNAGGRNVHRIGVVNGQAVTRDIAAPGSLQPLRSSTPLPSATTLPPSRPRKTHRPLYSIEAVHRLVLVPSHGVRPTSGRSNRISRRSSAQAALAAMGHAPIPSGRIRWRMAPKTPAGLLPGDASYALTNARNRPTVISESVQTKVAHRRWRRRVVTAVVRSAGHQRTRAAALVAGGTAGRRQIGAGRLDADARPRTRRCLQRTGRAIQPCAIGVTALRQVRGAPLVHGWNTLPRALRRAAHERASLHVLGRHQIRPAPHAFPGPNHERYRPASFPRSPAVGGSHVPGSHRGVAQRFPPRRYRRLATCDWPRTRVGRRRRCP